MKRVLISLALIVMLLSYVPRTESSLNFSGTTDKLNCGSGTSLDSLTTSTILAWYYPTAFTTAGRISQKALSGAGAKYFSITTGGFLDVNVQRATTGLLITASSNALTANSWWFIGTHYNSAGVSGDQELFVGSLTAGVAEVTGYTTQSVGSGAVDDNSAADQIVGNKSNDGTQLLGRLGWIGIWNRSLSLGEIRDQQFNPHVTSGNVLFVYPGYNETGTNADWSGNGNNCTVTGTTVANHVPLGRIMN